MRDFLLHFPSKAKLAALAVVVFMLFATVSSALAETKAFGSCPSGSAVANLGSDLDYTLWQSNTYQYSGCIQVQVRLRQWSTIPSLRNWTDVLSATNATSYAELTMQSGDNFVAGHKVRVDSQLSWLEFTSHDGAHSTLSWYCHGQSTGGSGGACNGGIP